MLRVVAAAGAAVLVALVASAAIGQGQNAEGRFQLTAENDGFLRLDTQTGALSFCQMSEGRWVCAPVETGDAPDLGVILDRLAGVEGAIADIAAQIVAEGDDDIAARLAAIEGRLAEIAEQATAMPPPPTGEALLGALDEIVREQARLAEIIAALGEGEAADDDIARLVAAINDRLAAIEGNPTVPPLLGEELQALRDLNETLLGRIEALDTDFNDALAQLAAQFAEFQAAVALPETTDPVPVEDLAEQLADIEEHLTAQQDALAAIAAATEADNFGAEALGALQDGQRLLAAQLDELAATVATAREPGANVDQALTRLGEEQTAIRAELAALRDILVGIQVEVDPAFLDTIDELLARQARIEDRIDQIAAEEPPAPVLPPEIGETLDAIMGEIAALRAETAMIEERVTALGEAEGAATTPALADELARIEAELAALHEAVATLRPIQPVEAAPAPIGDPSPIATPEAETETPGFGTQLFMRLEALARSLRRGFGADPADAP